MFYPHPRGKPPTTGSLNIALAFFDVDFFKKKKTRTLQNKVLSVLAEHALSLSLLLLSHSTALSKGYKYKEPVDIG